MLLLYIFLAVAHTVGLSLDSIKSAWEAYLFGVNFAVIFKSLQFFLRHRLILLNSNCVNTVCLMV